MIADLDVDAGRWGAIPCAHDRYPIDTLKVRQDLRDAGFEADQADAITGAIRAGVTGGVATKADIAEIKTEIVEIKSDLKWMKAIGGALVALMGGLVALMGSGLWILIERLPPI